MFTPEDVSTFVDRLTSWLFGQKIETVLLVAVLAFLGVSYWRQIDENAQLRRELIELAKEKAK